MLSFCKQGSWKDILFTNETDSPPANAERTPVAQLHVISNKKKDKEYSHTFHPFTPAIDFSVEQRQLEMTRIRKHASPSIADQLPKQMAQILYGALKQETLRSNSENRETSSEHSQKNEKISSKDELLKEVKLEENSTWRFGLHKRTDTNVWPPRNFCRLCVFFHWWGSMFKALTWQLRCG